MGSGILSVGIDIGTSTTQVIFSRIEMENTSSFFAVPHISSVDKEVIYKSDIYITPLINSYLIDGDKVRDIVAAEFEKAGFSPEDTQTGAVIITGESARKENSAVVLKKLSSFAGDFVVSTAGPDLETVNLDIGGGTTNIVVFDCGKVVGKGCLDIGGRLLKLEKDYSVTYVSPTVRKISDKLSLGIEEGRATSEEALNKLCAEMVNLTEQNLGLYETSDLAKSIVTKTSTPLVINKPIRAVCFSGGVADCIYNSDKEPLAFGDIGVHLGKAFRQGRLYSDFKLIKAKETIRATVVGAGTYTTSISGSTIAYSESVLPIKNTPVLKLTFDDQARVFEGDKDYLKEKLNWFMSQSDTNRLVLAMEGDKNPSYLKLRQIAQCIGQALDETLPESEPMIIITECDIAKALGQALKREYADRRNIISIDNISVDDGDFVDLGKPLMDGLVIPVVVKTLIFG